MPSIILEVNKKLSEAYYSKHSHLLESVVGNLGYANNSLMRMIRSGLRNDYSTKLLSCRFH